MFGNDLMPSVPEVLIDSTWFSRFFGATDKLRNGMKLKHEAEGVGRMGGSSQYCLRWNNHRNNLLAAFDQLLNMEALTDVTLACEDGVTLQAHRLVLAACSSYFQSLFVCPRSATHPIVVLKDVRAGDMRALLHYMYRGEVNVNHDDLPALLSLAETLKVKGLVEELATDPARRPQSPPLRDPVRPPTAPIDARTHPDLSRLRPDPPTTSAPPPSVSAHDPGRPVSPPGSLYPPPQVLPLPRPQLRPELRDPRDVLEPRDLRDLRDLRERLRDHHDPRDSQEPRDTHTPSSQDSEPRSAPLPLVPPMTHLGPHCPDSPPHKRKRGMLGDPMLSPTPILRTALAHSHGFHGPDMTSLVSLANSMMPLPGLLTSHAPHLLGHDPRDHLEGQYNVKKEHHDEDNTRAFPDITRDDDHDKIKMESTLPNGPLLPEFNPYHLDPNGSSHFSNFVSYVPTPKPEWKRYKQYTKTDLMDAIEAVRNGMTALQASRKYKVPSRTLYDKIKKMGISTLPRRLPNKKPSPSSTDIDVGGGGVGMGLGMGGGTQHEAPHHPPPPPPQPHLQQPPPPHSHTPLTQDTAETQSHQERESQYHHHQHHQDDKARGSKVVPSDEDDQHSTSGTTVIDDDEETTPTPTPAVGSFSLVGRKLYENGSAGGGGGGGMAGETSATPLDLTDTESLIPKRPEIEERA